MDPTPPDVASSGGRWGFRVLAILLVGCALTVGYWVLEHRDVAARFTKSQAALQSALEREAHANTELAMARVRISDHEIELASALARAKAIGKTLGDHIEERTVAEERIERVEDVARLLPSPAALRMMDILTERLTADGHQDVRVLRADGLGEVQGGAVADSIGTENSATGRRSVRPCLQMVEVAVFDPRARTTTLYVAAQLELLLDRASEVLTFRFIDGFRVAGGTRETFAAATGHLLHLTEVDAEMWETRLPTLVQATGDAPVVEAESVAASTSLSPPLRRRWAARINDLLALRVSDDQFELKSMRGLDAGRFTETVFAMYDTKGRLLFSVEAQQAWIEIDPARGVTWLALADGTMHRDGRPTRISTHPGQRVLLTGIDPVMARRIMQGMVIVAADRGDAAAPTNVDFGRGE